jgi:predicted 2-oxoglutarate/Fe(II)-dependent dioxygenase YbiX/peroxiredoxin
LLKFVDLAPGDPAPWFKQRTLASPSYAFDTAAGRYLVLCFFGSAADPHAAAAINAAKARPDLFDDKLASFFGVSADPGDEAGKRFADSYPGYRFFLDQDMSVSRLYGVAATDAVQPKNGGEVSLRRLWMVVDPRLQIMRIIPFRPDRGDIAELTDYLAALPPVDRYVEMSSPAPIIFLPDVFSADFCQRLIGFYEAKGGEDSGYMREIDGKTVLVQDPEHKRRRDHTLADQPSIDHIRTVFQRRIAPEVKRIHQFDVTRMERYLVACYDAADRAHFRPHRDNTTKGTAHRRFAVTLNLNADFEGGELTFPEYGSRTYKPPPGAAIVFSCSMLHAVTPVTKGKRFAFLPFLYDEAAAVLRQQNQKFVSLTPKAAEAGEA